MAALWNKLTFSSKTNLSSNNEEAPSKRTRKQSLSARSRKSLAQIFPNVYGDPSTDKENAPAIALNLDCEEAANYPIYDPENPDHNTAYQSPARPSRPWSPLKEQVQKGKLSLRSKSPSPTRMLTSSRKALNGFANSVKATAAAMRPSSSPAFSRDMSPISRHSEKSVKSKKSVQWRSSESTALVRGGDEQASPKDIPKNFSPILPDMVDSEHFLGSQIALTARPPPTPILSALEQADQRPHSIEMQRPVLADITQLPLLTPMPGTNLPLEDPFDDAAAVPESDIKIFEDPDCASDYCSASPEPVPKVQVLIGVAPSSFATLAVSECLEHLPTSRASSKAYDADNDSYISEDSNAIDATARIHPKPPNMRAMSRSSSESVNINNVSPELQAVIPKIQISGPGEDHDPKGHLGVLQMTPEVSSAVSFGLALSDSDKENQCHGYQSSEAQQYVQSEHVNCGQGCRVPSLTEPVKHDVSPPDSPPRQPPVAQLTTAKKLPPFQLQANVTSTSPPRDAPAFRFTNSSDESMSIVDETEYSWHARSDSLDVKKGRTRTPSPAGVPLPQTPMQEVL